MKKLFTLFCILTLSQFTIAQRVTTFQASGSTAIWGMDFDEEGNRYLLMRYKGTAAFMSGLPAPQKNTYVLARLDKQDKMVWVQVLESTGIRDDFRIVGDKIHILGRSKERNKETKISKHGVLLETYSLSGKKFPIKVVRVMEGRDAYLMGKLSDMGILTKAKWKNDYDASLDGKALSKKKYSAVTFQFITYDGDEKWSYTIEGGFNGFTDLRIGDMAFDKQGNTYIVSYFSESAELGIASYSTSILNDEGSIPLYEHASFLLKIDAQGKAVHVARVSDYDVDFEKLVVTDDEQVYLLGYFKGSDAYEKANAKYSSGNYKAAKFLGEKLPDTQSDEGTTSPSEDLLIALVDKEFKLVWKQTAQSYGYARARSAVLHDGTLHVCGSSDKNVRIDGKELKPFAEDGYSDMFYISLDAKGKLMASKTMYGPKSNLGSIYVDNAGRRYISGSIKENISINGKTYSLAQGKSCGFLFTMEGGPIGSLDLKEKDPQIATPENQFDVGDRIEGNWKSGGTWYPGKIGRIQGEKVYIQYDDGDVEWTTLQYIRKPR